MFKALKYVLMPKKDGKSIGMHARNRFTLDQNMLVKYLVLIFS